MTDPWADLLREIHEALNEAWGENEDMILPALAYLDMVEVRFSWRRVAIPLLHHVQGRVRQVAQRLGLQDRRVAAREVVIMRVTPDTVEYKRAGGVYRSRRDRFVKAFTRFIPEQ